MNERMYYSREAEVQAQRERLAIAAIAALLGVGIGTLLALIFAPQSGEKTRRLLGQQVEQLATQGRETANQVAAEMRDNATRLRGDLEDRLQSARS